jgi:hypothetical protein
MSQLSNAVKSQATQHQYRRVLPLRSRPSQRPSPPTAHSGPRTPRQGTHRPGLAGSFPPTEPRFPGPRSSLPGHQRPTGRHATDSASCEEPGGLTASGPEPAAGLRFDLPSRTPHPGPHHGGRSTLGGRVPLPDPVGPAQGLLVGQRSRETGERVRKDATRFQRRDSRGTAHVGGACLGARGPVGGPRLGAVWWPSLHFPKTLRKKLSYEINQSIIGLDVKIARIFKRTRYFKIGFISHCPFW